MLNGEQREALKVGDKVGIRGEWSAAILTVTKRTAAQLILSDNSRWTIKTGRKFGSALGYGYQSLVSEQEGRAAIEEIRQRKAIGEAADRLNRTRWRNLTLEQLAKFLALLDEVESQKQ